MSEFSECSNCREAKLVSECTGLSGGESGVKRCEGGSNRLDTAPYENIPFYRAFMMKRHTGWTGALGTGALEDEAYLIPERDNSQLSPKKRAVNHASKLAEAGRLRNMLIMLWSITPAS